MYLGVLSVFLTFLVLSSQAPIEQTGKCAKKCSEAESFIYEYGKVYNYEFETKTRLSFDKVGEEIKIAGIARIFAQKDCNFELKLDNIQLIGIDNQNEYKTKLERDVLVFSFDDGLIANVCPVQGEERWSLNIKKAILSGLQVTPKALGQYKVVDETDILGNCETTYETASKGTRDGTKIMKKKNLNNCVSRAHVRSFLIPSNLLNIGPTDKSIDYPTNSDYKCIQTLNSEGLIRNVECTEENIVDMPRVTKRQYHRETSIKLALINVDAAQWTKSTDTRIFDTLLFTREIDYDYPLEKIEKRLYDLCMSLKLEENSNKIIKSPENFKKLSRTLRGLGYEDVKTLLVKVKTSKGINGCYSSKIYDLLESALVVSGGKGAIEYFTHDFDRTADVTKKQSLTVLSLPFLPDPSEDSVKAILPFLRSTVSPDLTLLATSLIGNHVKVRKQCPSLSKPINEAIDILISKIPEKCSSNDENEMITIIKALGNIHFINSAGKAKLIACVENVQNSDEIRVAAIDALRLTRSCAHKRAEIMHLVGKLFTRNNENDEVEASAYRLLVECGVYGDQKEVINKALDILKLSQDKRIFNYLLTFLKNFKQANIPEIIEYARLIEVPSDFQTKVGQFSRNYRYSQFLSKINTGVDVDIDVIYNKDSKYPKKATFRVHVPTRREHIELIEFELRQESDEQNIDSIIDELKKVVQKENFGAVVDYMKNLVKYEDNRIKANSGFYKIKEKFGELFTSIKEVSWSFSFNGNTLIDRHLNGERKLDKRSSYSKIHPTGIDTLVAMTRYEDFGMMLFDSTIDIPTVSGLPVRFCATATLLSGTRLINVVKQTSENKYRVNFWPNFAFDLTLGLTSSLSCDDRFGFQYKTIGSSNFGLNTAIKSSEDRYEIELRLPEGDVDILKLTSGLYVVKGQTKQMLTPSKSNPEAKCYTGKYTGISICNYNVFEHESTLLDNYIDMGVYVKPSKTDLKGWKSIISFPEKNPKTPYWFLFSNIDSSNEDLLELKLTTDRSDSLRTRYDFHSKCPKAKIAGTLTTSFAPEDFVFELDYDVNGKKRLISLTNKADDEESGQVNFATKLRVDLPFLRVPIGIDGNMNLHFKVEGNKMVRGKFFYTNVRKGTQIRIFTFDINHNVDKVTNELENVVSLQIGNLKFKKYINFQSTIKQQGPVSINSVLEYRFAKMVKSEKINFIGKYDDNGKYRSGEKFSKYLIEHEMTFTQWPSLNYHAKYNSLRKMEEVETEFVLKWSDKMDDDRNKLRFIDTLKSNKDGTVSKSIMYYGPTNFQYSIDTELQLLKDKLSFDFRISNLVNLNSVRHGKLIFDYNSGATQSIEMQWRCPAGEKNLHIDLTKAGDEYLIKSTFKNEPNNAEASIYEVNGKHPYNWNLLAMKIDYDIVDVKNKLIVGKVNFENKNYDVIFSIIFKNDKIFIFEADGDKILIDAKDYFYLKMTDNHFKDGTYIIEANCKSLGFHSLSSAKYERETKKRVFSSNGFINGENIWTLNGYYERQSQMFYGNFKSNDLEITFSKKYLPTGYTISWELKKDVYVNRLMVDSNNDKLKLTASAEKSSVILFDATAQFSPFDIDLIKITIPSELEFILNKNNDDRHLRLNLLRRGYLHETNAISKGKPFNYEINSKSIKHGAEVYSMKTNINVMPSKYEYDIESSLSLPKILNFFIELGSTEKKGNRFGIKYEKTDQNKRSNSIAFRALRSKRETAVETEVTNDNELQWKADASFDKEKGVNALLHSPVVRFNLKANKDMTLESSLTSKVVPIEYHTAMKYHENEKVYWHDMKFKGKTIMRMNYTRTPGKIVGDFETYKRTGDFVIEKLGDLKGSMKLNYMKKVSGVKRSMTATSDMVGENLEININAVYDTDEPNKIVEVKITVPMTGEYKAKIESKAPSGCTMKINAETARDYTSSKMNLDRKCPKYSAQIDYERVMTPGTYNIKLTIKKNDAIVTDLKFNAEHETKDKTKKLKANLTLKSDNNMFDGTSISIDRTKDDMSYKLSADTKLPFISRNYKLDIDCKHEGFKNFDTNAKLRAERTESKVNILFELLLKRNNEKFDYKLTMDVEQNGVPQKIFLDEFHFDGAEMRGKTEIIPLQTDIEGKLSMKGDFSMYAKVENVEHIKVDRKVTGDIAGIHSRETNAKIFGFPITAKYERKEHECHLSMNVKPVDKNYPYILRDELRFFGCYEDNTDPCVNLEMQINHKLMGLSMLNFHAKVNRKGKFGRKHEGSIKFTNDKEDREDQTYKHTLDANIDKQKFSYNGDHAPMDRTHELIVNDRVFRTERHDKDLADGKETTINVWSDYKSKPEQKLTFHRIVKETENGGNRKTVITHPVLKKPIEITIDYTKTKGETTTTEAKVYIDFSDVNDENLHLDLKYEKRKDAIISNKISHIHIYRNDKKADLKLDDKDYREMNPDGPIVLDYLKKRVWTSEDGSEKSVHNNIKMTIDKDKTTYSVLMSRLSEYFSMSGYIGYTSNFIRYHEIKFDENGPITRIESNVTDDGKMSCYYVSSFEVPAKPNTRKQLQICVDKNRQASADEPFGKLMLTEEGDTKPIADFSIKKKPGVEKTYIVSLKWNVEAVGDMAIEMIQKVDQFQTKYEETKKKMKQEMAHLRKTLLGPIREKVIKPVAEHGNKEWKSFVKANPVLFNAQSHLDTNEVRSISKRSLKAKPSKGDVLDILKRVFNFKFITYNPDEGEIVFEFGFKRV